MNAPAHIAQFAPASTALRDARLVSTDAEEQREEFIRLRMKEIVQQRRNEIVAGVESSLQDAENDLLDHFANEQNLRTLIRAALSGNAETTGLCFNKVLTTMLQNSAEVDAIKEAEQLDEDARTDPDRPLLRGTGWMRNRRYS